MDWKLEVVIIPTSDVDRAKAFYVDTLGFTLDVDHVVGESFRVVQVTPPGSACSISFGIGLGGEDRGKVHGTTLVVRDIEAAAGRLDAAGVEHGGIVHYLDGVQTPGPDPSRARFNSFIHFSDPDGNSYSVQENADDR